MILYFSGTGNSEYAAKRIGQLTGDRTLDLFGKLRSRDFSEMRADRPWVAVAPTYAWRIPRIVEEWLKKTPLAGNHEIYFVLTCGGSIGNAGSYLQKLCAAKGLVYRGCLAVKMPENYLALFPTPAEAEARGTLRQAEDVLEKAALCLREGNDFPPPVLTWKDKLNSGPINDLFYPMLVHADKFFATGACISCGKCVQMCPLENIRLESGRPLWGKHCTHCMACISRCPAKAIEYGKHTKRTGCGTFAPKRSGTPRSSASPHRQQPKNARGNFPGRSVYSIAISIFFG